jgi:hypothetical protein
MAELQGRRERFVDADFPPSAASLGEALGRQAGSRFEFARFSDCSAEPLAFTVGGFSPNDVVQGELGDCWLISSFAVLASRPELLAQTLLTSSGSSTEAELEGSSGPGSAAAAGGVYGVRLWKGGQWRLLLLDDSVVVKKGVYVAEKEEGSSGSGPSDALAAATQRRTYWSGNWRDAAEAARHRQGRRLAAPAFACTRSPNELWPMLLEKAFAKWHGSYGALTGGTVDEGLTALVPNSVGSSIDLAESSADIASGALFARLRSYAELGFLLGAGSTHGADTVVTRGIVQGHAYSLLRVVEEADASGSYQLLCLRNPWGKTEWAGAFSDSDKAHWSARMRARLQHDPSSSGDDGIFWMLFSDFCAAFATIYVCRTFREGAPSSSRGIWRASKVAGSWRSGSGRGRGEDADCSNVNFSLQLARPGNVFLALTQVPGDGSPHKGSLHSRKWTSYISVTVSRAAQSGSRGWPEELLASPLAYRESVYAEGLLPATAEPLCITASCAKVSTSMDSSGAAPFSLLLWCDVPLAAGGELRPRQMS